MPPRVWTKFPHVVGDCAFAKRLSNDHLDDYRRSRERDVAATHVVAHQTGRTWIEKQLKKNPFATDDDLLYWILQYYWRKGRTPRTSTSSHYLIWWDGTIYQLADEHLRVGHVGVSGSERDKYLSGEWRDEISPRAQAEWDEAWPEYKSPQHLFASKSINDCSIGVEMPPCVVDGKNLATPLRPGLWFTREQHLSFCLLTLDIARRWYWRGDWMEDPRGGPWSPRVAGHSDFDLYGRSTAKAGMWDPGGHRKPAWWDWHFVYAVINFLKHVPGITAWGVDILKAMPKLGDHVVVRWGLEGDND